MCFFRFISATRISFGMAKWYGLAQLSSTIPLTSPYFVNTAFMAESGVSCDKLAMRIFLTPITATSMRTVYISPVSCL
jgi:hypothetical protein